MDAARNIRKYYFATESTKLDEFLGRDDWRIALKRDEQRRISLESFVINEFNASMEKLGFQNPGLDSTVQIYSDEKNLLLYRLVLYSRKDLGNRFWKEIKKSLDPQRKIIFPYE